MTREKAIKVLEMFLHKQCDLERTKFAYDANTVWEAVNMASEALEQEDVLDKIRAEIESITPKAHIRTGKLSIDTELMIPLDRVLKVLDKYKGRK